MAKRLNLLVTEEAHQILINIQANNKINNKDEALDLILKKIGSDVVIKDGPK